MKIAVASIIEETCSFNPVKMTLRDFKETSFKLGPAVVDVAPNELVVGGFVAALRQRHLQLEGIISTHAGAGGALSAETFSELKGLLISGLKRTGRCDAVFLSLMGAMAAEGEPDATGVILAEVRELVGRDCLVAVAMDHHGLITQKVFQAADIIVGYETQPHDFPAAGAKTARVLLDVMDRKRTPRGALVRVPMITPQDHYLTAGGPMKEWFDLARRIEKDPAVMVASTFPTQPWFDVPEYGWTCAVYADDENRARAYAEELAEKAWALRQQFWRSDRLSVPATVEAANAEPKGLVVISDTGDSAWGGAPGDSMILASEMLRQGLVGPALVPVVDPEALEQALAAGIGRMATLRVGGKHTAEYSPCLELQGLVRAADDGGELDFGDGRRARAARSVLFECGNLKLAICERADLAINHPIRYTKLGVDVDRAQMAVLKTASNFQYFRAHQSRLIRADSPGATQSDLTTLNWANLPRPIFPFDRMEGWK